VSRRILVITYYYPPSTASGAHRWHAMVRHMGALGHQVWVVTSSSSGAAADDAEQRVIRAPDLVSSPALRRALRRPALEGGSGAPSSVETPPPALLTQVVVPDSYLISWVPAAVRAARRVISAHAIDCVITSGPPDSAHLGGLMLGRRRPAWIADFRDGWTFEPLKLPWPTAPQRALDRTLERAVATHADAVVGATRPIAEDLGRRLGARARWISNGWDPLAEGDVAAPPPGDGRFVRLVHTGTMSLPGGRDPRLLLEALRRVNDGAERPIKLILAGRLTESERALIEAGGHGETVEHVGLLDRGGALALQRSADGLLLLTGNNRSEATGKLFEYLAAGRPIVALAGENEAARIVSATRSGVVAAPDDPGAIEGALRALARSEIVNASTSLELEPYVYPGPARAMLELVEEVIARR
jgi:glycosyltransferase involved in cell wall biosynthesis